jgi:hypothetical protein
MKRYLLPLAFLLAFLPAHAGQSSDKEKLIGTWRYEDATHHLAVSYIFRPDGRFTSELWQNGERARKLEGLWAIDGEMLLYIYTNDSRGQAQTDLRERDRLIRIDESSYTIEAGDQARRTYWRVK